jgi:hypothetical protein
MDTQTPFTLTSHANSNAKTNGCATRTTNLCCESGSAALLFSMEAYATRLTTKLSRGLGTPDYGYTQKQTAQPVG